MYPISSQTLDMKRILLIAFVVTTTNSVRAQSSNCERITKFGEAELCLAKVNGYKECYLEPKVRLLADMTEVPINMVLGFYLNNSVYEKRDSLGLIRFDDYFKIYGTKEIKDYKADKSTLDEMQKVLAGNFISKNWEEMEKEIDKIDLEVQVGVPTVIDSYTLNNKSFTYIMLARYELEGVEPYTMAMALNGMLLNERLVWMAYYRNYTDQSIVDQLKTNSNKILSQLMKGY